MTSIICDPNPVGDGKLTHRNSFFCITLFDNLPFFPGREVTSVKSGGKVERLSLLGDPLLYGFKRYVVLAVLARNIQQLGVKLRQKELAVLEPGEKLKKAA